jgi:hypothetical protein
MSFVALGFERLTRLRVSANPLQNPQVSAIHAAPDFVLKGEAKRSVPE